MKLNISAAGQELPLTGLNTKAHQHVHKTLPLFPALSQIHAVHILAFYLFKIHFNIVIVFLEHRCTK